MAMRILAVIPARAGSKGIPNKNIRIVNGHPLVYYSIRNAKQSKYITDIIITTDSEEVILIAKQMGVAYKRRDAALSGDSITLDSVIFDAIPDGESYDYIVTMQPTSPTLKVETLDKAIEYAINNDLDTVISAINAPHLTWGERDGKKVPNYTERLNRQYLPACYSETGAFVISRSSIVTEKTRIGEKVDVYEIPEEESQDIDTFADLQSAALTLRSQKVAIYVNGNNSRGTGHIYRALELADEFFVKPDIYFDINQTKRELFGQTTHNLIPVNGINELFEICRQKQYDIFINDILNTSADYMIALRNVLPAAKIINFEDDGEGSHYANAVFNALYENSEHKNIYAGYEYYICAKPFLFFEPININDTVKNVLITFGGADPMNYTERLLNIIEKEDYKDFNFTIVLGKAKEENDIIARASDYENITVLKNVPNMAEVMSANDIAITSRGRTGYELAILGVPTIAMAQNKREAQHGFISEENGFEYLGLDPSDEIIEGSLRTYLGLSKETREKLKARMLSKDLKNGRSRVMGIINNG